MSELDPEIRHLLEAARAADEPTEADRHRVAAMVAAQVGGAALGASLATAAAAQASKGTAAAVGGVGAGTAGASGAALTGGASSTATAGALSGVKLWLALGAAGAVGTVGASQAWRATEAAPQAEVAEHAASGAPDEATSPGRRAAPPPPGTNMKAAAPQAEPTTEPKATPANHAKPPRQAVAERTSKPTAARRLAASPPARAVARSQAPEASGRAAAPEAEGATEGKAPPPLQTPTGASVEALGSPRPATTVRSPAAEAPLKAGLAASAPAAPAPRVEAAPPVPAAPAPALQEELVLLQRAQDALRGRRYTRALRLAEEHAERFPRGSLVRERLGVMALARCGRGDTGGAAAQALLASAPSSPLAARVREACGKK